MFEHKSKPLLPRSQFYGRMARSVAAVTGIVAILMAPLFHRFLHTFHLEVEEETEKEQDK
jgi:hypothetical protein